MRGQLAKRKAEMHEEEANTKAKVAQEEEGVQEGEEGRIWESNGGGEEEDVEVDEWCFVEEVDASDGAWLLTLVILYL